MSTSPVQKFLFIFLFLFFLLCFRVASVYYYEIEIPTEKPVRFLATVSGEPVIKDRYQQLTVRVEERVDIVVFTDTKRRFSHGEETEVIGTIEKRVINGKDLGFSMYFPTIEPKNTAKNTLYAQLSSFRENILIFYEKSLPPTHASLLFGIVFGRRERMPESFNEALRTTGVMHVVAASGMNVALVGGALVFLFGFFLHRRITVVLSILGIVLYTIIAGLSPSLVRAAIMGSIGLFASLLGRQHVTFLSILFAAGFMLFLDPLLLSDIGFQLSFAATAGIVLLTPLFPFTKKKHPHTFFAGDFASTTSAQIATLPILFYYFKSVSLLSIGVNMLVLWTVPVLMALGTIAAVIGIVMEPAGRIVLYMALPLLTYFITIISFFGQFELQLLTLEKFPLAFAIGYYLVVSGVALFLLRRRTYEKNR